jgi:hypothetical protein
MSSQRRPLMLGAVPQRSYSSTPHSLCCRAADARLVLVKGAFPDEVQFTGKHLHRETWLHDAAAVQATQHTHL